MSVFVWRTLYNHGNTLANYNIDRITVYFIITNLLAVLFSFDPIYRLGKLIHTGKLNQLLIRPVHLLYEHFAFYLGRKSLSLFIVFPVLVGFMIVSKSFSIENLLIISGYCIACLVMFFLMVMCISTLSFWVVEIWPLRPVLSAIYMLLGGLFFPLDSLPLAVFKIIKYNPFSLIGHSLTSIVLGNNTSVEILVMFGVVIMYSLLFSVMYNLLIKMGLKHYEGGGN